MENARNTEEYKNMVAYAGWLIEAIELYVKEPRIGTESIQRRIDLFMESVKEVEQKGN